MEELHKDVLTCSNLVFRMTAVDSLSYKLMAHPAGEIFDPLSKSTH